jgi:hypothetical protein
MTMRNDCHRCGEPLEERGATTCVECRAELRLEIVRLREALLAQLELDARGRGGGKCEPDKESCS